LTLYKTGIRIRTLGELRERHIDFDNRMLNLDGQILKNHDYLKLPIDEELAESLKALIAQNKKIRAHCGTRNEYVFITQTGRGINNSNSNTNAISKQLSKYADRYDLNNINAHAIRRTFAKNLLNRGATDLILLVINLVFNFSPIRFKRILLFLFGVFWSGLFLLLFIIRRY